MSSCSPESSVSVYYTLLEVVFVFLFLLWLAPAVGSWLPCCELFYGEYQWERLLANSPWMIKALSPTITRNWTLPTTYKFANKWSISFECWDETIVLLCERHRTHLSHIWVLSHRNCEIINIQPWFIFLMSSSYFYIFYRGFFSQYHNFKVFFLRFTYFNFLCYLVIISRGWYSTLGS